MSRPRRVRIAVVVALLALALVPAVCLAAEAPAPARPFAERVAEAYRLIDTSANPSAEESVRIAERIETLLPADERVRIDGRDVAVDNSVVRSLAESLGSAKSATARTEAAARLERHLASLASAVPQSTRPATVRPDAAKLRELAEQQTGDPSNDFNQRFAELVGRIAEWLSRLIDSTARNRPLRTTGIVVFWLVIAALSIALLVTFFRLGRRLAALLAGAEDPQADTSRSDNPVVVAAQGLPTDALAYAEELASAGRFREAVRALFGGAARRLVERGLVAQTRTRTDGELLAEVRHAVAVHSPLHSLTHLFERAWYGHDDPGIQGFAEARARYSEVLSAVELAAREARA